MLGRDYSQLLARLINRLQWRIDLPADWERFFKESGLAPTTPSDTRVSGRVRVRTHAVAIPEGGLPAIPRPRQSLGIYTSDFSRQGFGFVADRQFYPAEAVRILLPTFWMRVRVVRCRRLGPRCFENGTMLVQRCEPSVDAFADLIDEMAQPAMASL